MTEAVLDMAGPAGVRESMDGETCDRPDKARRTRVRRMADRELEREDWLAVARQALIEEGINAVRVERLAKTLGVTRGGFYWRFRNLEELLDALVEDWRASNSRALLAVLDSPADLSARFDAVARIWLQETGYNPAWDTAMREWGRVSPSVAVAVHAVDAERIAVLQAMFAESGVAADVALVRARILYFHQMGYYALDIRESRDRRDALMPIYKAALTGLDPDRLLDGKLGG
jgi:AcrR family transcriptional regulator